MVEHQRQILEAQKELLDEQRKQAASSVVDRRIQYVIMTVSCLALVAAVSFGVGTLTNSLMWLLIAARLTAMGAALFARLVIARRRPPKVAAPLSATLENETNATLENEATGSLGSSLPCPGF